MRYEVRFVPEDAIPVGVDYCFVKRAATTYLFIKRSTIDESTGACAALSRAWTTWQWAQEATDPTDPSRAYPLPVAV